MRIDPPGTRGMPVLVDSDEEPAPPSETARVEGVAVAPGRVEGTVRVILDPRAIDEPLEAHEIVVARTTDPSWASIILSAGAFVIDVGGPMSHAAIVARELGVPCVIGTQTGTSLLRTGDRVVVDGVAGTIEILARAGAGA